MRDIRRKIYASGYTIIELSAKTGIEYPKLSNALRGDRSPSLLICIKIMLSLGEGKVNLEDFLPDEDRQALKDWCSKRL